MVPLEVGVVVRVASILGKLLRDQTQKTDVADDVDQEEAEDQNLALGAEKLAHTGLGDSVLYTVRNMISMHCVVCTALLTFDDLLWHCERV